MYVVRLSILPLVAIIASGCATDDGDGDLVSDGDGDFSCYESPTACIDSAGTHTKFVANQLTLPQNSQQAEDLGMDLDGDPLGRPDNALGTILAAVSSYGVGLQSSLDQAVQDGQVIVLVDLQATSLTTAADAGTTFLVGANPTPLPCTDEADPTTCGQHLDGSGSFEFADNVRPDAVLHGDMVGGLFVGGPGKITLVLDLALVSEPITFNLIGAQTEFSVSASGIGHGRIAGAVTTEQLFTEVLPSLHGLIQERVTDACGGVPPDCCESGSNGAAILRIFDTDNDCQISIDEIRTNSAVANLLAPDVDLLDGDTFGPNQDGSKDAISLGIGFTAIPADFPDPR